MIGSVRAALQRVTVAIALLIAMSSQGHACLDGRYARLSPQCTPQGTYNQILSTIFDEFVEPRQIAVIAGVSDYPNLPRNSQLPPAAHDMEMLQELFVDRLKFDEVIVLKNADFTFDNLKYIFQIYLPEELSRNPRSRVVFAFSGHGADFEDSGYLFKQDTSTVQISSYDDTEQAIDMELLKVTMKKTIAKSQHFLALINACNGGHFLNVAASFGGSALEEKGAHAITAGGADDAVHASENVGSGKGSVFFEMVDAAFSGKEVTVGGRRFADPGGDDGIMTATELAEFLTDTIEVIENYQLVPRMGRLRPPSPGYQGEFFFVVDQDKAVASLERRFPQRARRYFGAAPEPRHEASTANAFDSGFSYPSAADQSEPDLIVRERILSGDYKIINDRPWRRKALVSDPGNEVFQPRAASVDGDLYIVYLEKEDSFHEGPMFLREYNLQTGENKRVDELHYDGQGYYFDAGENMKIVGDYVYYFSKTGGSGRKYKIGSNEPATDESFFSEANFMFETATSPNGRYIVAANSNNWAPSALASAPADYLLAMGDERGEFTGLSVYDKASKEVNMLFKQDYTGDWSIGSIIWSDDNTRIFFDNSGAVACIWEYNIAERELRKIVPEHSARQPYFFRYQNRDYVLYINGQDLMVATE